MTPHGSFAAHLKAVLGLDHYPAVSSVRVRKLGTFIVSPNAERVGNEVIWFDSTLRCMAATHVAATNASGKVRPGEIVFYAPETYFPDSETPNA